MAELAWGASTHPGQIRPDNEDDLHASHGVYVVADGMGGHEAGEVASALAVERIREALTDDGDGAPTAERVVDAITRANGDIFRAAIATPAQAGMGTTVTVIAVVADPMAGRGEPNIDDNDPVEKAPDGSPRVTPVVPREQPEALVLANVGDSRTYLYRHGRLRRATVDHSYVQELVTTGHITDDEARTHPRRNIITRALGIEPDVKVDWWTLPLVRGDRFLLCSDGLVDEVDDVAIAATLEGESDPQAAVDSLIEQANTAGGRDNVTIIVLDVLDGDDPPDPTQELDVVPTWAGEGDPDDPAIGAGAEVDSDPIAADARSDGSASDGGGRRRRRFRRRRGGRRRTTVSGGAGDVAAAGAVATAGSHDVSTPLRDRISDGSIDPSGPGATESTTDGAGDDGDDATSDDARRPTLVRAIAAFVVLALLVAGFVALAAWARRGYFVDFDDDDQVVVYQGRPGGLLWFDPTAQTAGGLDRDELSGDAAEAVEDRPTFDSVADATLFVRELDRIGADPTEADPDLPTTAPPSPSTSAP
ncbi:protein phosphatase 2C domain-containing protein [Ilumatobacter sp.]|uniref:PP2C family serine/threonine-protein phosphatase n=1 Tax=Ilumatobacter sp. TaxID=1967498 RepID=UPI003B519BA5